MKKKIIMLYTILILSSCENIEYDKNSDKMDTQLLKNEETVVDDSTNEIFKLICTQNTTRSFTSEKIKDTDLEKILYVAFNGATSGGQQGREVIVVDDKEIMEEIKMTHPYASSLNTAPLLIIVAGNENSSIYPENLVQDTSIATQNIVLMASALNIDTNIMSIYPQKDRISGVQKALNLPEHIVPHIMISMGYSKQLDTVTSSTSKSEDISEMVYYNTWND